MPIKRPKEDNFRGFALERDEHQMRYGRPISVRLNDEERQWVEEIKQKYDMTADSTALKHMAEVGYYVLQADYMAPIIKAIRKQTAK